jgi:hypothetical protein
MWVESFDCAGNMTASEQLMVTVDTTPPAAPTTPTDLYMNPASDTGTVDFPGPTYTTSIRQPSLTGWAEIGSTVMVFAISPTPMNSTIPSLVGQTEVRIDSLNIQREDLGLWEVTLEPLADGAWDIFVIVEDCAGNSIPPGEPQIIINIDGTDPLQPLVALLATSDTGMSQFDKITSDTTPDLIIAAEAGASVTVFNGTTPVDMYVSSGVDIRTMPALPEGQNILTVIAIDGANNMSQSEQLVVTVDTTEPSGSTPDLLYSSDTGKSSTDNLTSKMQPAFDGTTEANAKVFVYARQTSCSREPDGDPQPQIEEVRIGEGVARSDGTWEVTVEPLADGCYSIWAEYEDLAGNVNDDGSSLFVEIDGTPPAQGTINIDTEIDDCDVNVEVAVASGDLVLRVTSDDGPFWQDDTLVEILDGNDGVSVVSGDNPFDSNEVDYRSVSLGDGAHILSVFLTDCAGNTSQSEELRFFVDSTAPEWNVAPGELDTVVECGSSTDPSATGTPVAVDDLDATPDLSYVDLSIPGSCDGEQQIERTWFATDQCGNVVNGTQTITVVDTTPPAVTCPESYETVATRACEFVMPDLRDQVSASDACGVQSIEQEPAPGTEINAPEQLEVTFIVSDGCNQTECSMTIDIECREVGGGPDNCAYAPESDKRGTLPLAALFMALLGLSVVYRRRS